MFNQHMFLRILIPHDVAQTEIWELEERLNALDGVTAELLEPKNLFSDTISLLRNTSNS